MNLWTTSLIAGLSLAGTLGGCASTVPVKPAEPARLGNASRVSLGVPSPVSTRSQLEEERSANNAETAALRATNTAQDEAHGLAVERLELGKAARTKAAVRRASAMAVVATFASVTEETRGVVITLNGSLLFAPERFVVLETAKARLDQVAAALIAQSDDQQMLVEGHTADLGTGAANQPLSLDRANAVRDYLIIHGVSGNRLEAVGVGSTRPLFDNDTVENRAANRRIEIVVQPSRLSAR